MWEGGLPPIAVVQSPDALTDTLQSGASPLPHLTEPDLEDVKKPATDHSVAGFL